MRVDWKVRGLGFLVAAAAVPAFLLVDAPAGDVLAVVLLVVGAFTAVVVAERAVPAPGAEAVVSGDALALDALARGLKLKGRPWYVPDQGNVGAERLFLPASENPRRVPVLDADTVAYAGGGDTKPGVALPPPGLALVNAHVDATGTDLKGGSVGDVEAFLSGLTRTLDLASGVRVTRSGKGFRVRFHAGAVTPPCFSDPADPLCARSGCALCQATGCALARALDRPVQVTGADVDAPRVTVHFEEEAP